MPKFHGLTFREVGRSEVAIVQNLVLRWKATFSDQFGSYFDEIGIVQRQNGNRCSTLASQPLQAWSDPGEVTAPLLPARIEQSRQAFGDWIKTGNVRAFVAVAVEASQGQIAENGFAAVLSREDVIDGEGDSGIKFLSHLTILAPQPSAGADFSGQRGVHQRLAKAGSERNDCRAFECNNARRWPALT